MNRTNIEWTDLSANPLKYRDRRSGEIVWGCVKHSAGCAHCYSETIALRYKRGGPFTRAQMAHLEPFLDDKELHHILTAKTIDGKPVAGSKCFLGDMTDLFGEWVSDALLDRLFATIALRPDVTFQVLTKRADRMARYVNAMIAGERKLGDALREIGKDGIVGRLMIASAFGVKKGDSGKPPYQPFPNLWLGISAENQAAADERIPELLATPAAVRFLSCEPLLGPVKINRVQGKAEGEFDGFTGRLTLYKGVRPHPRGVDWVIVGGESGPGSREMQVEWVRDLVKQCKSSGTACFVKQLGARPIYQESCIINPLSEEKPTQRLLSLPLKNHKGNDPDEWPADLRVRQFPEVPA